MPHSKKRWKSSWPALTRILMGELRCQRWEQFIFLETFYPASFILFCSLFVFTVNGNCLYEAYISNASHSVTTNHNIKYVTLVNNLPISSCITLQLAQILPTEENFLICFREFVGSSSEFMAVSWHIYTSVSRALTVDMQRALLHNPTNLVSQAHILIQSHSAECKELASFLLCFFWSPIFWRESCSVTNKS